MYIMKNWLKYSLSFAAFFETLFFVAFFTNIDFIWVVVVFIFNTCTFLVQCVDKECMSCLLWWPIIAFVYGFIFGSIIGLTIDLVKFIIRKVRR